MRLSFVAIRRWRHIVQIVLLGLITIISGTVGRSPIPALAMPPLAAADWAAIHALLPMHQQAYFKPSQVSTGDGIGYSVAVSGDIVVVGAPYEDSSIAGVQNSATPLTDEMLSDAGAAYVFVRNGTTWSQQAYLKASQVSAQDLFGVHVAIAGETIVVGASHEDSSTLGIQNSATPSVDENASGAGAAYVFVRSGTTWSQQAYLKASQVSVSDRFGVSVAVSGDTVVVGAVYEDSSSVGVQNSATPQVDEAVNGAGAAYVFVRSGTTWSQQAYLKAGQVSELDDFGWSVAVSDDIIAVSTPFEDSSTTGVQNRAIPLVDEMMLDAGAVYVFVRNGTTWSQQAYLKASEVWVSDLFGNSVALSGDIVVVGAPYEDSSIAGVQNSATPNVDEGASGAGAAYVFVRSGTTWSQQAYLKASQVSRGDMFGVSVAVAGNTVVVGAQHEDSSLAGVQNNATPSVDENALGAGAAYVFGRSETTWSQQTYLKASQVSAIDFFGNSVAVSGETVVVGSYHEGSSTAGIQHGATPLVDENAPEAGAVYGFASHAPESYLQYLPFIATN